MRSWSGAEEGGGEDAQAVGREGASESPQVALSPSEGSQDNSRGIRRLLWTAITTKETLCCCLLPAAGCSGTCTLCCALLCAAACCRKHQKPHTPGARVDGRRSPVHPYTENSLQQHAQQSRCTTAVQQSTQSTKHTASSYVASSNTDGEGRSGEGEDGRRRTKGEGSGKCVCVLRSRLVKCLPFLLHELHFLQICEFSDIDTVGLRRCSATLVRK